MYSMRFCRGYVPPTVTGSSGLEKQFKIVIFSKALIREKLAKGRTYNFYNMDYITEILSIIIYLILKIHLFLI